MDDIRNINYTFETKNRKNINKICISKDDKMLLTVDEEGQCVCNSFIKRMPIHFFNFKSPVRCIQFSPDNKLIAAGLEREIRIYDTPIAQPQFRPFNIKLKLSGSNDHPTCLDWNDTSDHLVIGTKEAILKVIPLHSDSKIFPILKGFKGSLIGCYFEHKNNLLGVDKFGVIVCFEYFEKKNFWKRKIKHNSRVEFAHVSCVAFEKITSILVMGFDNGIFSIYDYNTMEKIQQISATNHKINSISINNSSDWLALACSKLGQLVVWEHKTESYVLRQQGHSTCMKCATYSPNGCTIATGSEDGKVKLWNTYSGFCFVTFEEHTSAITSIVYSNSGNFIVTASLDGTCRAFDVIRYRNFRTLVAPQAVQFSCVSIDSSDEIICGCAVDSFEIYVWSLLTGRLLETIASHSSPVVSLRFIPNTSHLISCSWDFNVYVWDILNSSNPIQSNIMSCECINLAVHPFRSTVAVCTIRADIHFWDFSDDKMIGTIEGIKDLGLSRKISDKLTAKSSSKFSYFNSLDFSSDGQMLIACGKSKYICIYNVESLVLIRRIDSCCNQSLDGVLVKLNSKKMTEAGNVDLLDSVQSDDEKENEKSAIKIPGTKSKDLSLRKSHAAEIQLSCVSICPTARSFICVSTEGLLLYSKDEEFQFDPIGLSSEITPDYIEYLLIHSDLKLALCCSVKINQIDLIRRCLQSVPYDKIRLTSDSLPINIVIRLLEVISDTLEYETPHLQFYLQWCTTLLMSHGLLLKNKAPDITANILPLIRKLQKSLSLHHSGVGRL